VRQGTRDEAKWFASAANKQHDKSGLKRTSADKRKSVLLALGLEHGRSSSSRVVADHIGVSYALVQDVRKQLTDSVNSEPKTRKGKDGKQYKTTKKPRTKAAAESKPSSDVTADDVTKAREALAANIARAAERRIGQLLMVAPKASGAKGIGKKSSAVADDDRTPTLKDHGITKTQSFSLTARLQSSASASTRSAPTSLAGTSYTALTPSGVSSSRPPRRLTSASHAASCASLNAGAERSSRRRASENTAASSASGSVQSSSKGIS
jgi:hypothetical protein